MKRALVTGGCGFIGSNLSKELVRIGWQVDIVDDMSNGHLELVEELNCRFLPGASFINAYNATEMGKSRKQEDVTVIQDDFSSDCMLEHIQTGVYDVVFHQAAVPRVSYSVEHPGETTDINIGKTVHLFKACAGSVDKVIFASSSSVYGGADQLPTREDQPKKPKSPYAWQKSAIEDFAAMCWELYQLDIVCLRYFNVFGPGQYGDSPYSTAVSAWCHSTKNSLECRSDGDGSQSRDMCYIDNVVSANILAANHDEPVMGDFFNIACGDRTTNKEILEYFVQNLNSKVLDADARPGDVMHTQADITKAGQVFGYKPTTRFWDGLERTITWWGLK